MTTPLVEPDKWVERYSDMLYNYAFSRVSAAEIAEDLVQETLLAGLRNLKGFRNESTEKTWLFAILKRKVIDHYRKKSRNQERNSNFSDAPFSEEGGWVADKSPRDWSTDLDTLLDNEEFMVVFGQCLARLPEKWSACFTLKNLEDYKAEDICKELDISASNYWVILHRARLRLRECLEVNWLKP